MTASISACLLFAGAGRFHAPAGCAGLRFPGPRLRTLTASSWGRLRRGGKVASPKDQGGRADAMPTPLPGYLLPKPLRRLFQILGCLIFYGQFTSIALCRVATDPQLGAHVPRHWHAARDLRRLVLHFSFPCHGPDRDSAWEQASPGSREARDCGRGALGLSLRQAAIARLARILAAAVSMSLWN